MLPVALAAALVMLPSDQTAQRYSVWIKPRPDTAVNLLAEKLRVEARELREAKKPADALPLFNAAVLLRPDDYTTRVGRAKTFAALGRYDEQADEYIRVISRYPHSSIVWSDVAEGWIARGKWDEAERCFAHAAELALPGEWRTRVLLQEAEYWLGEDQTRDALKLLPAERMVRAHLALCAALESPQDVSDSTRQCALASRAWVRFNRGWYAESAEDYDELLALSPTDARLHFQRAEIAFEMKDFQSALGHADKAERNGGDPDNCARVRCMSLVALRRDAEAKALTDEWGCLDPEDRGAVLTRAITLRLNGQDDEADQVTAAAAERGERTFGKLVYDEMYALWVWCGRLDAAERLLTRRIPNSPDTSELAAVYANRGELRRQRGATEEAFEDLTACVRLRPHYFAGRTERAKIALELRRYHTVLEDAKALTRMWPHEPDGHKLFAEARNTITMAAAIAGREPDYRPAGPLVAMPRNYSFGAALVAAYLPNR